MPTRATATPGRAARTLAPALTLALLLGVVACGPPAEPETWDPATLEPQLPEVVAALRRGDPDGALEIIEEREDANTAPEGIEHYRGMALVDAGRSDEALAAFEAELAERPGNGQAHMLAAEVLTTLGRLADARDHLARAGRHGGDPVYSNLLRGRLALLADDDELAQRAFQDYLVDDRYSPRAAEAHHGLAQIARRQGRDALADGHARTSEQLERVAQYLNLYRDRLAEDPDDAEAALGVGMIYLDLFNGMGRDPEMAAQAEAAFAGCLERDPRSLKALLNLAFLRSIEERFPEAIALLERALALDPEFAAAHLNRGLIARRLGALPEAIARFEAAVRHAADPVEHARALYELAVTQEEADMPAAALASYEACVALQPDPPPEIVTRMDRLREHVEALLGEG